MRVLTIGGDMKTIDGIIYRCQISDQDSNIEEFVAHGLDEVTGTLQNPLLEQQLRKMFPVNSAVRKLVGTQRVDYLLGLGNPSWQPERITKANGGGDFWLYQNKFGICIGGSHPWVTGRMEKSAGMYTVLSTVRVGQQLKESLSIPTCGGGGGQSVCLLSGKPGVEGDGASDKETSKEDREDTIEDNNLVSDEKDGTFDKETSEVESLGDTTEPKCEDGQGEVEVGNLADNLTLEDAEIERAGPDLQMEEVLHNQMKEVHHSRVEEVPDSQVVEVLHNQMEKVLI